MWYAASKPGTIQRSKGSGLKSKRSQAKPSGAYLFRPNQTDPFPLTKSEGVTVSIYKGKLQQDDLNLNNHMNEKMNMIKISEIQENWLRKSTSLTMTG